MDYSRSEAKDWAAQHWRGVCNVIMPSYTSDLQRLNERAIRHDVRKNIEHGFWGALLVSECGTTLDEYRRFMEIAVDEAKGRHHFLLHGTFDTPDQIIAMAKAGESIGVTGMLLGQPNSFYPKDEAALYDYLSHVAGQTNLAVCMFCTVQMNLARLHPSGYPPNVIVKTADLENVVAVKYEVGRPGVAGDLQISKLLKGKRVLFSDPLEANSPLTVEMLGMQWMGTSNYEYWGGAIPEYFGLLQKGEFDRAMEIYWRINPARQARVNIQATFAGANFIHRYLWKYQGWLHGYNGGPMRQPVMKLNDTQMRNVRDPLLRSGFKLADEDAAAFYQGRNPA
jgi:dihydrodipicolinate synthase/N-acetylneuraminate lyase